MALKDWKKEKLSKGLPKIREVFSNKKDNKIIVVNKEERGRYVGKKEIVYSVSYGIVEKYGSVGTRYFKTKSQALQFVKAYMRKH